MKISLRHAAAASVIGGLTSLTMISCALAAGAEPTGTPEAPFPAPSCVAKAGTGCATIEPGATVPITVGPGQAYQTLQAAADAAKPGDILLLPPGTYREVVHLRTPNLHVIGTGKTADDVVIEAEHSAGESGGTSRSATVFAEVDGIEMARLTIANRFHDTHPDVTEGAQAIALSATGDRQQFIGIHLIGWQDTLYAGSRGCNTPESCRPTRQYYEDTLIEGAVDFVFGDALAWFERPELRGVKRGKITVTAQSRRHPDQNSGYVFHDCKVTGDASAQTISLGRPWRDYATVTYVNCWLDARVVPDGFTEWQGEHRLPTARYAIIDATGPGAAADQREPWLVKPDESLRSRVTSPQRYFAEAVVPDKMR